ncbi:MAG TPA: hypothetical protein VK465_11725 [Fibrobacteria bacterium]|nr:hypothetical protein [Fibrobacteria bacterium]
MNTFRLPCLLISAAALSASLQAAETFQRRRGWDDTPSAKAPATPSPETHKSKPVTESAHTTKPPAKPAHETHAAPPAKHAPRETASELPPPAPKKATATATTITPLAETPKSIDLPDTAGLAALREEIRNLTTLFRYLSGTSPATDFPESASLSDAREEIRNLSALLQDIAVTPASKEAPAETHGGTHAEATDAHVEGVAVAPSDPPADTVAHPIPPAPAPVVPAPAAALPPALDLKADIQIQGERRLTTARDRDNLDEFWGRLNFGAEYKTEGFQSKANIRVFPEGFGFEPLTGATFDTSGQGALKTQSQPAARVVVNHAWVRTASGPLHAKIGRFETQESHSSSYGNYIDLGPSGRFLSRPAAHNALEAGFTQGPHASTILLGTGDRYLNRGFVRLLHHYRAPSGLDAALGWKANIFDQLQFPDDEVLHRFDVNVLFPLPQGFTAFAEAALLQSVGREDDIPLLLGLQLPTTPWLDRLSLEAEWMSTRKAEGEDKPILLNLHARKTFGRANFETALFSDAGDKDMATFGLGLRMTTTLK